MIVRRISIDMGRTENEHPPPVTIETEDEGWFEYRPPSIGVEWRPDEPAILRVDCCCGKRYEVSCDGIPPAGGWSTCPQCRATVNLRPMPRPPKPRK